MSDNYVPIVLFVFVCLFGGCTLGTLKEINKTNSEIAIEKIKAGCLK